MRRRVRVALVLWGALLRIHPLEQRRRYGDEMTEVFARRCEAADRRRRLLRTALAELAELGATGLVERTKTITRGAVDMGRGLGRPGAALRAVARHPGQAAALILTLALGLGIWIASLVTLDAVVLSARPAAGRGELVELWTYDDATENDAPGVTLGALGGLREADDLFAALEGMTRAVVVVTAPGLPEQVAARRTTPGFFGFLGVAPALGRGFAADDPADVVVLSHEAWASRFGAARDALGRRIELSGEPHTVIGVMPRGFRMPGGGDVALWMPLGPGADAVSQAQALGRLRPGLGIEEAVEVVGSRVAGWRAEGVFEPTKRPELIAPLMFKVPDATVRTVWIFAGAASLILLVAVANVLALLLARGLDRRAEWSLRRALGAARGRLVVEAASEGAVQGLFAGAAAVGAAWLLLREGVVARAPENLGLATVGRTFDPGGAEVLLGLAIGAAVVALGAAAVALLGTARGEAARPAARTTTQGRAWRRLSGGLVVAQVAFSFLLLAGGGLLLNSLVRLTAVETGFDEDRLLVATLTPRTADYPSPEEREALYDRVADALAALPGAAGVTEAELALPLVSGAFRPVLTTGDGTSHELDDILPYLSVRPGFFAVTGGRLLEGRDFLPDDPVENPIVVGERLARSLWPAGGAVGQPLRIREDEPFRTVVGVAADMVSIGLRDPAAAGMEFYEPLPPGDRSRAFIVRADGPPEALVTPMRARMSEIDPALPFQAVRPLADAYAETIARERFAAALVVTVAALGLLVTLVGLYGLLAHQVRLRTREIGIRMTLGARPGKVLGGVLLRGLAVTAVGVALGVGASLRSLDLVEALLYGVAPNDPWTLAAIAAVFLLTAAAASLVPALRALRVDPMESVRTE